jgi:hypothetical protein
MARKVHDALKHQTRRVVTAAWAGCLDLDDPDDRVKAIAQAPHKVGDVRWVREPLVIKKVRFTVTKRADGEVVPVTLVRVLYPADTNDLLVTDWREYPARLAEPREGRSVAYGCPREFSRRRVTITDVRLQRLQDITPADAIAEGIDIHPLKGGADRYRNYLDGSGYCTSPVDSFRGLWDSINAARGFGWETNPSVLVYSFSPTLPSRTETKT